MKDRDALRRDLTHLVIKHLKAGETRLFSLRKVERRMIDSRRRDLVERMIELVEMEAASHREMMERLSKEIEEAK